MPADPITEELLSLHLVTKGAKACIGQHMLSYGESKHSRSLTTGVGVSAVKNASWTCFVVARR